MTFNGIMALILCYSTGFGTFGAYHVKVVDFRSIQSVTKM